MPHPHAFLRNYDVATLGVEIADAYHDAIARWDCEDNSDAWRLAQETYLLILKEIADAPG